MNREKCVKAKNGLRIYSLTSSASHSFFISLFLKSGCLYESEGENGITHFLEHVSIRSVNSRMGGRLYEILDKYGLEFNASTFSEMVQFYISGASQNLVYAKDIISKLLLPLQLSGEELLAEADRIRAEIREGGDRSSLAHFAQEKVWGDTPLSRPITGRLGNLRHMTLSRLEEYRRKAFTPENTFVYVTGNVTEEGLEDLKEAFGEYPLYPGEGRDNVAVLPEDFCKRNGGVYIKNADFTKLRFNFDLDMSKLSVPETDLLYDQLLGGYNSRLFTELSEKRGICYDLGGSVERYKNAGSFSFSYELKPSKIYEAIEITCRVLSELKEEVLREDECMKAGYVDNALMLYDDPRELNFTFAYDNYLMNLGYGGVEDRMRAYSEVSPERLSQAAKEIFTLKNLTLAIKGNKKSIDPSGIKAILERI